MKTRRRINNRVGQQRQRDLGRQASQPVEVDVEGTDSAAEAIPREPRAFKDLSSFGISPYMQLKMNRLSGNPGQLNISGIAEQVYRGSGQAKTISEKLRP